MPQHELMDRWRACWRSDGASLVFVAVLACQAATIVGTWRLWDDRVTPPVLPLLDWLPAISMGVPLLATLAFAAWRHRDGAIVHLVVLIYALLLDQIRIQPEFVSMAILLLALAHPRLAVLGRAHLVTLWTWAGVHKLLSVGFAAGGADFVANALGLPIEVVRWAMPLTEVSLGLIAVSWRARHVAVAMAFGVHGVILLVLLLGRANPAVWMWNIALPLAAAVLLTGDRSDHLVTLARTRTAASTAGVIGLAVWSMAWLYPAGFYIGVSEAYLAHNLYSRNTARALVCDVTTTQCSSPFPAIASPLRVPFPPQERLFRQVFDADCEPGEVLRVSGINTEITTFEVRDHSCPDS